MNSTLLRWGMVLLGLAVTLAAPLGDKGPVKPRKRPETTDELQKYLQRYGYMPAQGSSGTGTDKDVRRSLKAMQRFAGLKETGEADNDTMNLMATPRCGVYDQISNSTRRKRYVLYGRKWPSLALTYYFRNFTSDFSQDFTRSDIQRAFKFWSDVTQLKFTETTSPTANIKILFAKGDHGDSQPFDGPGRVLAHAFYPTVGEAHFDEDETWTYGSNYGTNLLQVGTHEMGHILGLEHSTVKSAVMFPYYTYKSNFNLDEDDIKGIQALYGLPRISLTTSSSTSRSSTTSSTSRSSTTSSTSRSSATSSTSRSSATSSTSRSSTTSSTSRSSTTLSTSRSSTTSSTSRLPSSTASTTGSSRPRLQSTKTTTTTTQRRQRPCFFFWRWFGWC